MLSVDNTLSCNCSARFRGWDRAHRDLKPANVFLVPEREAPSGERTKILDFGIAKFYDSTKAGDDTPSDPAHQLTTVGKLLGTPAYMSPEQCSGAEHIDDSIDVYALGVMLYQMLAGRLPFEAQHAVLIMTKHITEAPPPLSPVELSLPPPLCELVHEMLAKDRRDRPNMAQVVVRIEQLLESELGASSHQWRSQHRRRWLASRNFRRIALGALVVLSSVILIVIGQQRRSQRHARGTIEPPASMPAVPSLPEPASPVATPRGSESPTAPGAANPASAMSKPAKKNATATADSAAKERPSRKKSKEPKNTKGDFEISAWK